MCLYHRRKLVNNSGGGGESTTGINLIDEVFTFERWGRLVQTLHSDPIFYFSPLQSSSQKNYSEVEKILEGGIPPPQITSVAFIMCPGSTLLVYCLLFMWGLNVE